MFVGAISRILPEDSVQDVTADAKCIRRHSNDLAGSDEVASFAGSDEVATKTHKLVDPFLHL